MTPQEFDVFWSTIIKFGAALAVLVGIVQSIRYFWSLTSVSKLQDMVTDHDEHLKRIDQKLIDVNKRIDIVEDTRMKESQQINESLQMLGLSLTAIINHMIDTSTADDENKDDMIKVRDDMSNFFIKK
jgi:hypothetical protein